MNEVELDVKDIGNVKVTPYKNISHSQNNYIKAISSVLLIAMQDEESDEYKRINSIINTAIEQIHEVYHPHELYIQQNI